MPQDEGSRGVFDWNFNYRKMELKDHHQQTPTDLFESPVMAGKFISFEFFFCCENQRFVVRWTICHFNKVFLGTRWLRQWGKCFINLNRHNLISNFSSTSGEESSMSWVSRFGFVEEKCMMHRVLELVIFIEVACLSRMTGKMLTFWQCELEFLSCYLWYNVSTVYWQLAINYEIPGDRLNFSITGKAKDPNILDSEWNFLQQLQTSRRSVDGRLQKLYLRAWPRKV